MKKIGMFIGQINLDTQRKVILGVHEECKKHNIDCTVFSFFSSNEKTSNEGEFEYINRIDMDSFDGFILYAETIYSDELRTKLIEKIKSFNKIIVSIDYDIEIGPNIKSDNYHAMEKMTEHLIEEHNVKKVNFIGGPENSTDSKFRLQGVIDVLKEYGLSIDEKRIVFGDFLINSGRKAIEIFEDREVLDADVYICANDQMAIGAYDKLTELGYKVPEDCLLTGFDNIKSAKSHLPSISSIERRDSYIGKLAFDKLMALSRGEKVSDEHVYAEPVFRKSCCKSYEDLKGINLEEEYKDQYKEIIKYAMFSKVLMDSSSEFIAAKSIKYLVKLLPHYLREFNVTEMCLCIDEDIDKKELLIPLHYLNSGEVYDEIIDKKEIMPEFKNNESGNLSIMMPLHHSNTYFGYIVVNNYDIPLYNELFRAFINNVSNALEEIRIYEQTLEKSHQDHLTKLLTRDGFDYKAIDLYEECQKNNVNMFIIFSDLDGLKKVNDNLGHEAGDAFINDYAKALMEVNKKYNYLIMRYGGDEFVVFGTNATLDDANIFLKELEEYIEMLNETDLSSYYPYKLNASSGIRIIDNSLNLPLYDHIASADSDMYVKKKEKKMR